MPDGVQSSGLKPALPSLQQIKKKKIIIIFISIKTLISTNFNHFNELISYHLVKLYARLSQARNSRVSLPLHTNLLLSEPVSDI